MFIQEIWRYPVKSMAGEQVKSAHLTKGGIAGDRIVQVYDARGRVVTSRTCPGLLGLRATLGASNVPFVDGRPWAEAGVRESVRLVAGRGTQLIHDEGLDRFDILPLLVATDGAISAFGRDRRRLRPNIVVGGVDGLDERKWQGSQLVIGNVVIGVHDLRGRCIMTTFDPDTLEHDPNVLRDIVKRFGGKLALNCEVLNSGTIEVGQRIDVVRV